VVGMGKLGARELNVSSDIDLVYVYDQDGETAGTPTAAAASPTTNISPRRSRPSSA
jgi:glutamine synthetase adenylyltransferase